MERRRTVKKIEFNLLEEPWIRVRTPDCALQEVSLTDALLSPSRQNRQEKG